jgi:fibronectin type 3 domain-containing protein
MSFRKHAALALALASTIVYFGCTDNINAPVTTDDQPVLPPTNVVASALDNGNVQVKWDASSEPTINGYNLYRREVGHGGPKRLNSTRILTTLYTDQNTALQKRYEYRVTAVNSKGKESRFTAVVVITHAVVDDNPGKVPSLGSE